MKTLDITQTLSTLQNGGILLYPTDTIWGLGCDATNSFAVNKIIQLKGRTDTQSFIVLVHSVDQLEHYIEKVPEIAYSLTEISDAPLTIIYPNAHSLAPPVIAHDGTVAIRVVNHHFCTALLQRFGKPIVSTSANFSGYTAPKSFADIDPKLREQVDYCVDPAFETPSTGKPSSIIKLATNGEVKIIRK